MIMFLGFRCFTVLKLLDHFFIKSSFPAKLAELAEMQCSFTSEDKNRHFSALSQNAWTLAIE